MKIGQKLMMSFLLIVFLAGICVYVSFTTSQEGIKLYDDLGKGFIPLTKYAMDIQSYSKRAEGHLFLYFMLDRPIDRKKFFERVFAIKEAIFNVEPYLRQNQRASITSKLTARYGDVLKYGEMLLAEHDKMPSGFSLKKHEALLRKYHQATSDMRREGASLAKSSRELFLKQLTINTNVDINSYAKRAEGHLYLYLTLGSQIDRDKFFSRIVSLEENIRTLNTIVDDPGEMELVEQLKIMTANLKKSGNKLIKEYERNPAGFDSRRYEKDINSLHDSTSMIRKIGETHTAIETAEVVGTIGGVKDTVKKQQKTVMIVVIFILIMAVVLSFLVTKSIAGPVAELEDAVLRIGEGEFNTRIDVKSKDEIGILAMSINEMAGDLERLMAKEKKYVGMEARADAERQKAKELENLNQGLKIANDQLKIDDKILAEKVDALEKFKSCVVDRELRMTELKNEINKLLKELGREPK